VPFTECLDLVEGQQVRRVGLAGLSDDEFRDQFRGAGPDLRAVLVASAPSASGPT
jgi:hypothetical protein